MSVTCMSIAQLDNSKLERIQELEQEIGTPVIAVEQKCHWTDLDEERLNKLQSVEQELGVVLLAYEQE